MAEGDTIHRLARVLYGALVGGRVQRIWMRDRGELRALEGAEIREVSALGKHLLIALLCPREGAAASEWVLHTHLGMPGRWRRVAVAGARRRPEDRAIEIAMRDQTEVWVCTKPRRCELFPRLALRDHPELRRLGPDLLSPPVPYPALLRRARRSRALSVAELLLDQGVACGLGNVYKSELLFLQELAPDTPSADASDGEIEAIFRRGAELLAENLGPGRRRTRGLDTATPPGEPRFWVYDRAGRPCLRCATPIRVAWIGERARVTYWCPRCQRGGHGRPLRAGGARVTPMRGTVR